MTEPAGPIVPERPKMPQAGIHRLETLLRGSRCYLEYGSGGSTLLAGRLKVPQIISTESDAAWHQSVQAEFGQFVESELVSFHVNIGITREWGYPSNRKDFPNWPRYPTTAWLHARSAGKRPDLVLIDGRFRTACLLVSLSCGAPATTILFDDYSDRPYRDVVERFIQPVAFHDRMAEFVIPPSLELATADLTLALAQCLTNPA